MKYEASFAKVRFFSDSNPGWTEHGVIMLHIWPEPVRGSLVAISISFGWLDRVEGLKGEAIILQESADPSIPTLVRLDAASIATLKQFIKETEKKKKMEMPTGSSPLIFSTSIGKTTW